MTIFSKNLGGMTPLASGYAYVETYKFLQKQMLRNVALLDCMSSKEICDSISHVAFMYYALNK